MLRGWSRDRAGPGAEPPGRDAGGGMDTRAEGRGFCSALPFPARVEGAEGGSGSCPSAFNSVLVSFSCALGAGRLQVQQDKIPPWVGWLRGRSL